MKSSRARIAGSSAGLTAAASPPTKAVSCDVLASRAAWAVKNSADRVHSWAVGKRDRICSKAAPTKRSAAPSDGARFLPQACRQPPRLLERERAIRKRQGLLRHDALAAPVAFVHARHVEQLQKGHLLFVGVLEIEAPPRHRQPLAMCEIRPADGRVELPGHGQDAVAHGLGLHAFRMRVPQQTIIGIDRPPRIVGRAGRNHAIRLRGDHQSVHRFHAPAAIHELYGQPIEQRGIGRRGAADAKIENRRHQRLAKMPHPHLVHRHARRERIVPLCNPAGQRQPPAGAGCGIKLVERRIIGALVDFVAGCFQLWRAAASVSSAFLRSCFCLSSAASAGNAAIADSATRTASSPAQIAARLVAAMAAAVRSAASVAVGVA